MARSTELTLGAVLETPLPILGKPLGAHIRAERAASLFLSLLLPLQLISADKHHPRAARVVVTGTVKVPNNQTLRSSRGPAAVTCSRLCPYCSPGEMLTRFPLKALTDGRITRITKLQSSSSLEASVLRRHLYKSYFFTLADDKKYE